MYHIASHMAQLPLLLHLITSFSNLPHTDSKTGFELRFRILTTGKSTCNPTLVALILLLFVS